MGRREVILFAWSCLLHVALGQPSAGKSKLASLTGFPQQRNSRVFLAKDFPCAEWGWKTRRGIRLEGAKFALFRSRIDPNDSPKLMTLVKCRELCRQYFGPGGNGGSTLANGKGQRVEPCFSFNYQPLTRTCALYNTLVEDLKNNTDKSFYSGFTYCVKLELPTSCQRNWKFVEEIDGKCQCVANARRVDYGNCVCRGGYFPVLNRNACSLCRGKLVESFAGKCTCVQNAARLNNENCVCLAGYYRGAETDECTLCGGSLVTAVGDTCGCVENAERVDFENCSCKPGYVLLDGGRGGCSKCSGSLVDVGSGSCTCVENAVRLDENNCRCLTEQGYQKVNGKNACSRCQGQLTKVEGSQCNCVANATRTSSDDCQCIPGFAANYFGTSCVCSSTTINVNILGWADETSWEMRGYTGRILAAGNNYGQRYNVRVSVSPNIPGNEQPTRFSIRTKGRYGDNSAEYEVIRCNQVLVKGLVKGNQEFSSQPLE